MGDEGLWGKVCSDVRELGEGEGGVEKEMEGVMGMEGKGCVDCMEKELGEMVWEDVGMGGRKEGVEEGLKKMKGVGEEVGEVGVGMEEVGEGVGGVVNGVNGLVVLSRVDVGVGEIRVGDGGDGRGMGMDVVVGMMVKG